MSTRVPTPIYIGPPFSSLLLPRNTLPRNHHEDEDTAPR